MSGRPNDKSVNFNDGSANNSTLPPLRFTEPTSIGSSTFTTPLSGLGPAPLGSPYISAVRASPSCSLPSATLPQPVSSTLHFIYPSVQQSPLPQTPSAANSNTLFGGVSVAQASSASGCVVDPVNHQQMHQMQSPLPHVGESSMGIIGPTPPAQGQPGNSFSVSSANVYYFSPGPPTSMTKASSFPPVSSISNNLLSPRFTIGTQDQQLQQQFMVQPVTLQQQQQFVTGNSQHQSRLQGQQQLEGMGETQLVTTINPLVAQLPQGENVLNNLMYSSLSDPIRQQPHLVGDTVDSLGGDMAKISSMQQMHPGGVVYRTTGPLVAMNTRDPADQMSALSREYSVNPVSGASSAGTLTQVGSFGMRPQLMLQRPGGIQFTQQSLPHHGGGYQIVGEMGVHSISQQPVQDSIGGQVSIMSDGMAWSCGGGPGTNISVLSGPAGNAGAAVPVSCQLAGISTGSGLVTSLSGGGVVPYPIPASEQENVRYRKKFQLLKRTIKSLIFQNAALSDEVSRLNERIEEVASERRLLVKRLLHHERIRARAAQRASSKLAKQQGSLAPHQKAKPETCAVPVPEPRLIKEEGEDDFAQADDSVFVKTENTS